MREALRKYFNVFLCAVACILVVQERVLANDFQQVIVSGKIVGEDGSPLPGANVIIKGTTSGATTTADGTFKVTIPDGNAVLIFSYIGYISQELSVGGQSVINVTLQPDATSLSEVVVVGYGEQKKSDLSGSVSSVKGDDLNQLPNGRADQALQGRAAGVMVLNADGSPGGRTTIRIRGANSIQGNNNPLIVIDGLQLPDANLNTINPNDIESMEILKDASATAIYGAQGANGVILITTKKGKTGKPQINYNFSYGEQNLRKKIDIMNAGDYARTANAWRASQNINGTQTPYFTDDQISYYDQHGGTDWQNQIFRTSKLQNHQISIGGGGDAANYFVSAGYLNNDGILKNSGYKRFTVRANTTIKINTFATFGLSWTGSRERGSSPPFGEGSANGDALGQAIPLAVREAPTQPVYDASGAYSKANFIYDQTGKVVNSWAYGPYDAWNPLASVLEPKIENNAIRNVLNAYLEFKLLKGLTFRSTGGAMIMQQQNFKYNNGNTFEGSSKNGSGVVFSDMNQKFQNSNILTYDNLFAAKHHLTLTGVAEVQSAQYTSTEIDASSFTTDLTGNFDLGGAANKTLISTRTLRNLKSFMGRANYVFNDKYLATFTYRADGSSVFGKNNKWGYFPSAAVAWKLYEEDFIRNLAIFSDLKVRGSWGKVGSQAISPYQSLPLLGSGQNYPWSGGSVADAGFAYASPANPNLKWETSTQTDIGIDFGLFNGRLIGTIDVYKKVTKDLLLNRVLPYYTGFTTVTQNIGSMQNKGIEFAVSGDPIVGAFRWNTGFNISFNRNTVLDLGGDPTLFVRTGTGSGYGIGSTVANSIVQYTVGRPTGQMYGVEYLGVWKSSEAEEAKTYTQLPGDPKYRDVNGDHIIDANDRKVIGNAQPKFIYGWTNRLSYRNIDMTFLFQGVYGNTVFNASRIRAERPGEFSSARALDRWTPTHENTDVPGFISQTDRAAAGFTSNNIHTDFGSATSRYVESGSYLRLKNVMIGYTLPKAIINQLKITRLRIYGSAQNLLTFTKYTGYDPEVSSFNNKGDGAFGIDFANYPSARTYTFGVDLTF